MRPDEGACTELRRSLTARTKAVRSHTYAPARRRCARVGAPGVVRYARGVSASLAAEPAALVSARHEGDVTRCVLALGHRPVLGAQTPYGRRVIRELGLAVRAEGRPRDAGPAAGRDGLDGRLDPLP